MNCPKCGNIANKNGNTEDGKQKYRCRTCKHNFERPKDGEIIELIPEEKAIGLTEAQLRSMYDIRFIVATKCKELKIGVFLSRAEFVQFCGIRPGQGYTDVINHPDYDAFRGKVAGQVYYSHPDSIRKLKSEGLLT